MSTNKVLNATSLSKLTLTAISLCGLAVSTSAQTPLVREMAPERGFTIPSKVQTPVVLQTQPDAACDLHAEGVSDAANTMRIYADADGYVQVHASSKYESQADVRVQLDCTSGGKVTTYPLHLRSGVAPTDDMPAPQTTTPTPKGSRLLPALTDEDAKKLSDKDLIDQGYPRRPDAVTSPDSYKVWLDLVSRPTTLLPPHSVSRSDISHQRRNVEAGTSASGSANWSGYEAHSTKGTYLGVWGSWTVPPTVFGEPGYVTESAFWVGLDGDGVADLVQAGTEQLYTEIGSMSFASYRAWTEVVPNQFEQDTSIVPHAGDSMFVQVFCENGVGYFYLVDNTQGLSVVINTPLGKTQFVGSSAEWIMERPKVNGTYTELSAYIVATMTNAYAIPVKGAPTPSGTAATQQIAMYNSGVNHPDDNTLSIVSPAPPDSMIFQWIYFH